MAQINGKDVYNMALRFSGMNEVSGVASNPALLTMLKLDADWPEGDDVPWCSAFTNFITWLLRLPRSRSLLARSWLTVGRPVSLAEASVGDIVVLMRGGEDQPGPENLRAPGHVGFMAGIEGDIISVIGGNQNDSVNTRTFPTERVLGVRRIT